MNAILSPTCLRERKREREGKRGRGHECQSQTNSGGSMSRLCLAYPREPQSQSSQALLQSGDTSIRICNSDRIDRPKAKAQAKMRQGNLGQCF